MRVNAGNYKGKLLLSLEGNKTRPTSDKVRESIFNIINVKTGIEGRVLDLFAGTGALGIEALSRGASSAVFVDKNPDAVKIVKRNISFVKERTEVYNTDWKVAVRKLEGRQFDTIFIDPPYALGIENQILTEIITKNLLDDDGIIIIEHSTDNNFEYDTSYFIGDRRAYSGTSVTFLTKVK